MTANDKAKPIVIDIGSSTTKAGYVEDDVPRCIVPSIVGRFKTPSSDSNLPQAYVGEEAIHKRGILAFNDPIQRGIVTNWNDMEQIFHYIFSKELKIIPEEHKILIMELSINPKENREKTVEILFEKFNCQAVHLQTQAFLALCAIGKATGLVIDSGDGITSSTPVYEGHSLRYATISMNIAGRDLTDWLMKVAADKGYGNQFRPRIERELFNDIKAKHCYIAMDFEEETKNANSTSLEQSYELPDGQVITLAKERFQCPEILFRPSMIASPSMAVHEIVTESITKCGTELRKELASNIVLCGGTTKLPGFQERLEKELKAIIPSDWNIKIRSEPSSNLAWLGASGVGAVLKDQEEFWISKQEYRENGASLVHRKFF